MSESMKIEGKKFDQGKAEYGLIPPHALHAMVEVLTIGAKKYARDNWKHVPDRERRYFDAMQRHIWAWKRGEINDPEDGLHHLAHAMCCLMFLHEVSLYYKEGVNDGENKQEQNEAMAQRRDRAQLTFQFQSNWKDPVTPNIGTISTQPGSKCIQQSSYSRSNSSRGTTYPWSGIGTSKFWSTVKQPQQLEFYF